MGVRRLFRRFTVDLSSVGRAEVGPVAGVSLERGYAASRLRCRWWRWSEAVDHQRVTEKVEELAGVARSGAMRASDPEGVLEVAVDSYMASSSFRVGV